MSGDEGGSRCMLNVSSWLPLLSASSQLHLSFFSSPLLLLSASSPFSFISTSSPLSFLDSWLPLCFFSSQLVLLSASFSSQLPFPLSFLSSTSSPLDFLLLSASSPLGILSSQLPFPHSFLSLQLPFPLSFLSLPHSFLFLSSFSPLSFLSSAHPLHTHRVATSSLAEGEAVNDLGVWSIKPPTRCSSALPPAPPTCPFHGPFAFSRKDLWKAMVGQKKKRKTPLFASLINLPNDFPYREGEPPRDDSRSPRRWCGAWKQRGWNEGGQVTGFRWAFLWLEWVLRLCVSEGESAQWVTGHSAGWMLSWCGHLDSLLPGRKVHGVAEWLRATKVNHRVL